MPSSYCALLDQDRRCESWLEVHRAKNWNQLLRDDSGGFGIAVQYEFCAPPTEVREQTTCVELKCKFWQPVDKYRQFFHRETDNNHNSGDLLKISYLLAQLSKRHKFPSIFEWLGEQGIQFQTDALPNAW